MTTDSIPREEFVMHKEFLSGRLDKIESSLEKVWEKMDGRPSWSVLMIISFLSSLVVGLLTILFIH